MAVIELTKVATALTLAEQGRLTDFKGKKFEELTLDPIAAEPVYEDGVKNVANDTAIDSGAESEDEPDKKYDFCYLTRKISGFCLLSFSQNERI